MRKQKNLNWYWVGAAGLLGVFLAASSGAKKTSPAQPNGNNQASTSIDTIDSNAHFRNAAFPRGIRNNNPGNIVITPTVWNNEVPSTDTRFEQFKSYTDGVRALLVLLRGPGYINGGRNTPKLIIDRYLSGASSGEKQAYVDLIASYGLPANTAISRDDKAKLSQLTNAITHMENGAEWVGWTKSKFDKAWNLL